MITLQLLSNRNLNINFISAVLADERIFKVFIDYNHCQVILIYSIVVQAFCYCGSNTQVGRRATHTTLLICRTTRNQISWREIWMGYEQFEQLFGNLIIVEGVYYLLKHWIYSDTWSCKNISTIYLASIQIFDILLPETSMC